VSTYARADEAARLVLGEPALTAGIFLHISKTEQEVNPDVLLNYQLLVIWPSLNKEQHQQFTRTVYKGARFILQAPAAVDGSICCREAHILSPAQRYEILRMKRYDRI
jgi:hypothetical protein